MKHVLVVGAGFAGAVHARTLAEAGYRVVIIDRRPHIGGNAYDRVDANGIRVHQYGPHLFHSKNRRIIEWVGRFGAFEPYTHRVRALLPSGELVPLPINLETINVVFDATFTEAAEVQAHLKAVAVPIAEPANAAEYLYSNIGRTLTDLFFRPYTQKMWGMELEEMASAVVKRIPIRMNAVDTYFAEGEIQMMPQYGYTHLFENILDHPGIEVMLERAFDRSMLNGFAVCFNSMPIDEYFGYSLGELPYRSIRFHHRTEADSGSPQTWSVTNFTDSGPFTRETAWQAMPNHVVRSTGRRTITREEPCDYRANDRERYYPVKTADGRYENLYACYRDLARKEPGVIFIGRCGTYQYLDMDQVISQSLQSATAWLRLQS